jgi:sugar/nucleoside kinase (ribokinase family)
MVLSKDLLWNEWHRPHRVDVVGIGQSAIDQVVVVEGPPEFTGKKRIVDVTRLPGGQIATALLACTRLGLSAALVSVVGDDAASEIVLEPLRVAGVDLTGVRVVPGVDSQLSVIVVDRKTGERTVLWHRDSRLSMRVREVRRDEIEQGRVLHIDAQMPTRPNRESTRSCGGSISLSFLASSPKNTSGLGAQWISWGGSRHWGLASPL